MAKVGHIFHQVPVGEVLPFVTEQNMAQTRTHIGPRTNKTPKQAIWTRMIAGEILEKK